MKPETTKQSKEKKDNRISPHEIWSMAQLMPNEGISDGVARIRDYLKEKGIVIED